MCKSDRTFPNFQSGTVFEWPFKFISWHGLSQKWIITVPEEKSSSSNFIR